ncbi:MAG TPA: VOC family protein [Chitinophagales bacterium]|nr:VOC family protein [Chitinophagales bacterium]
MKESENTTPGFKTYGLTHLALAVKDVQRSIEFYHKVFGTAIMYTGEGWAQIQTPGTNDIIVLEENKTLAGKTGGGILHFGFRLEKPGDMGKVLEAIYRAGGIIRETGEFMPGEPYVFFYDPDGYEIEVWYEKE